MSTALPPGFPPRWQRFFKTPFRELLAKGPTGSLDWRVTLANADAPEPIANVISNVVRRSGLWSNEKQAVADELLAHFNDGLEAGATAEELVESFGDPAIAAKLIRRAKVRCRPLGWHAWWWATRGTAAVAAAYLALGFYLMSRRPQFDPSASVATVNQPIHSRSSVEKAWPDYARLLKQLHDEGFDTILSEVIGPSEDGWWVLARYSHTLKVGREQTPEQRDRLDAWVASHAEWFDELRTAAQKPSLGLGIGPSADFPRQAAAMWGCTLPGDEIGSEQRYWQSALIPHQELRDLADWLIADAEYASRQEEWARVLADLRAMLGLSRQAREPSTLINSLIADRIVGLAIGFVTPTLIESPEVWSTEQLRDLAHTFAAVERSPLHWLAGEEAGYRDLIDRLFAGERLSLEGLQEYGEDLEMGDEAVAALRMSQRTGRGGEIRSWFDTPIDNAVFKVQAAWLMPTMVAGVTKSEALRDAERLSRIARERANTPLWADPPSVDQAIEAMPTTRRELAGWGVKDRCIDHRWRLAGELEGLQIGLALEVSRREAGGAWPESLEDLTPTYLPDTPSDPLFGGPLGYTLVDGEPVAYSLGFDRDDDNGRLPAGVDKSGAKNLGLFWNFFRDGMNADDTQFDDGDWVLWSLAKPSYMADPRAGSE